ncbi:pentatricopeptide repeat-containing protein At2g13420, mitochondrial-like [Punica granatum]|uniref:Pentatricopeptide repeat-containing protein At2g13420, mitochondrial-like n=2 Tax=Punica granatum TaxID=22663 RepID=A0A6P8CV36_PUNGR|nr:pentatricopeptide repeat-containing protein At2g13420, mitochondrial-like [Punica granatum]
MAVPSLRIILRRTSPSASERLHLRRLCTTVLDHDAAPAPPLSFALPCIEPSDDADSISQILLCHHNPFHVMESSLQLHGVSLSPGLLHQSLLRLRHSSKVALALFNYAKSLPSPPLTPTSYDLLIDILGKVRQFDVVWQLIVEMDQNNCPPSTTTFLILVRRLIAAGLTRQAVRAFDDMESFVDQKAGNMEYSYLLDTLCKYGYVKLAVEIFNQRKSSGVFEPDAKMYTILIYGWCKIGRIDMGERFLNEMIERGIEPHVVTYNVLLNGICRRASLHPDGRFERTLRAADKVFDEMRYRGIEPDVTSYSIVLHVYSRAHKPELSLDKLKMMRERGICPSVATYTSVVKCLCSCGRIQDAEELLAEMVRSGVSPCAATYNCFFKEYRGRKDVEGAIRFYRKMKEDNMCVPTMHTYNILIGMFAKFDYMGMVKEIWEDMKKGGTGPDLDSYTLLVHELCKKERWREACKYFVEMIEKGFLPQKISFETLYRGLIQSDKMRTWNRLKKKLDAESITFGSEFQKYQLKPYRR